MRFTSLSTAAFVVASALMFGATDALRCKCTSNGFNSQGDWGLACCQKLGGQVLKNIVGNFLGCDSDSLGANNDKFNDCCKGYNSNYYRGCSVL
ncbi:hypothetical protein BG003_007690 [Podila horticola]|nr:hypothetical protein BG003_007690 [Podila horticola]